MFGGAAPPAERAACGEAGGRGKPAAGEGTPLQRTRQPWVLPPMNRCCPRGIGGRCRQSTPAKPKGLCKTSIAPGAAANGAETAPGRNAWRMEAAPWPHGGMVRRAPPLRHAVQRTHRVHGGPLQATIRRRAPAAFHFGRRRPGAMSGVQSLKLGGRGWRGRALSNPLRDRWARAHRLNSTAAASASPARCSPPVVQARPCRA